MSDLGTDDPRTEWMPILRRLNAIALRSEQFGSEIVEQAVSSGWQPPATESEICEAEVRLGVTLPPSYRSFLLISNGWRPFNRVVECLFPIQKIDRFRISAPETFAAFEGAHERTLRVFGDELISVSDEVYWDHDKHKYAILRPNGDSLLIGGPWEGCGTKLRRAAGTFLLDRHPGLPNGEWKTIYADRPKALQASTERVRSFREFFEFIVEVGEIRQYALR